MNEGYKKIISSYVKQKIVYTGSLSEIRDLLLFFDLLSHAEYRNLAGLTTDIHEIDGLAHVSWGVYRLHDQLSRRIHLNFSLNFTPKFLLSKRVNLNDEEVLDYLFSSIQNEITKSRSNLKMVFDLDLVKTYPDLLAILFTNTLDKYRRLNRDYLDNDEAEIIIKAFFESKRNEDAHIVNKILTEFRENQARLKTLFSLNYSTEDIIDDVRFFNSLTDNCVHKKTETAKSSAFARKGASPHLPPDLYATIITTMVFFVCNLAISAALKFFIPLIPIFSSPVTLLIVGAALSIIPIMLTIYLQFYISSRRKKHETGLKRKLIFILAEDIPAYHGQLVKSGFNLREFKKHGLLDKEKPRINMDDVKGKRHKKARSELSPFVAATKWV